MSEKLTVCVCGGGNGAHAMVGLTAAHGQMEARVLTLFQDEAERWTNLLKEGDFKIKRNKPDGSSEEVGDILSVFLLVDVSTCQLDSISVCISVCLSACFCFCLCLSVCLAHSFSCVCVCVVLCCVVLCCVVLLSLIHISEPTRPP